VGDGYLHTFVASRNQLLALKKSLSRLFEDKTEKVSTVGDTYVLLLMVRQDQVITGKLCTYSLFILVFYEYPLENSGIDKYNTEVHSHANY
jgi:hypothetical protein